MEDLKEAINNEMSVEMTKSDTPSEKTPQEQVNSEVEPKKQKNHYFKKKDNPMTLTISMRITEAEEKRIKRMMSELSVNNTRALFFKLFNYCERDEWGDFYNS